MFTGLIVVLFAVLVVTGVALSFTYRPVDQVLRTIHSGASAVLVLNTIALLVAGLGLISSRALRDGARLRAAGGLSVLVGALIGLAFTGPLLAWDQLALAPVEVGGGYDGIWAGAFDDDVLFLIINGVQVEQGSYAWWAVTHAVLLPLLSLGLLAVLVRRLAERPGGR